MGERLKATEQRQQQIMAFLAKAVQTPGFLAHLVEQNENNKCMAASARKKRRLPKEEDEGEVEDFVGHSTPTDNQIITLQNNGEVVGRIMQLLNPSDDLSLTIDNSYLDSLLQDYTSALPGSEGNSLNRHSGVTLTDLSTGLAENLQSDPALTDLRNNEGIVQLPQSPTSDIARLAGIESLH
jgi:heat shock transcription factor